MRIDRMGKVKIESDLVDISYRRLDKPRKIAIVEFQLKRSISPDEAADIASLIAEFIASFVRPKEDEVVGLSGRAPIYLYMMLQHRLAHVTSILGQYDPKLNAIVLTSVHSYGPQNLKEGQTIKLDEELKAELTQV